MKIVDLKTFLSLPAETLFSKYEPCLFDAICIKGDTIGANDFCYQPIADAILCDDSSDFVDVLFDAEVNRSSFSLDLDCQMRDGFFVDTQLFAVWEPNDVAALIERLKMVTQPRPQGRRIRNTP